MHFTLRTISRNWEAFMYVGITVKELNAGSKWFLLYRVTVITCKMEVALMLSFWFLGEFWKEKSTRIQRRKVGPTTKVRITFQWESRFREYGSLVLESREKEILARCQSTEIVLFRVISAFMCLVFCRCLKHTGGQGTKVDSDFGSHDFLIFVSSLTHIFRNWIVELN